MTVESDSTDESETEDEGGGESVPEQLAENLLKPSAKSKRMLRAPSRLTWR